MTRRRFFGVSAGAAALLVSVPRALVGRSAPPNERTVQIAVKRIRSAVTDWVNVPFEALAPGQRFRLFDNGVPVVDSDGSSEWTVTSFPMHHPDGNCGVTTA